jgi:hypothetical protein
MTPCAGRARSAARGGVAWLIEGDDKTRLGRGMIEQTLRKRGPELEIETSRPTAAAGRRAGSISATRRARRVAPSGATR